MEREAGLFRFETDGHTSGAVDISQLRADVLIVSLAGFMDAGGVQRLLSDHLLATLDHTVVGSFDMDVLLDYRGRRPMMTFDKDHFADYDDPSLVLYRVIDDSGRPFLLLHGAEPDFQWERFIDTVVELIRLAGVSITVGTHGAPMAVPHTRPVGYTLHSAHEKLRGQREPVFGTIAVPASAANLLELRLGELDRHALGVTVHVPHYLAQSDFPIGSVTAVEQIVAATGLDLPDAALQVAAAENLRAIDAEVQQAGEAGEVVAALEQQYDNFIAGRQRRQLLAGDDSELPTADQLAEEFEEFLREQTPDDGKGPEGGTSPTL